AELDAQRAVGWMHGGEDAHAERLEALLDAGQGVERALGRLQLDAGPAQADLLQETQLVVAGRGWHAVGELDVLGVVLVEDRLARLRRREKAGLMQRSGCTCREGRL